ncbi:MAG: preprotein translocase subunit YajC [Coriobacteriales bacterium]|nr:preprotein translocase subunit YajC [Coriobacteriales bacterium]
MNQQVLTQLLIIGVMIGAFWFLLIRPQQQQRQRHEQMVQALTPGVRVLTIGGVYGVVTRVMDEDMTIEIAEGVEIDMIRNAVAKVVSDDEIVRSAAAEEYEDHSGHDDPIVADESEQDEKSPE